MVVIARREDGFVLYERPSKISTEWRSFKLEKRVPGRRKWGTKRNWWIGWNGERLSRNRDVGIMAQYDPELMAWVVETLRELSLNGQN